MHMALGGRLTAQQVSSYRENGYLILGPLFSRSEIDVLRARIAQRYAHKDFSSIKSGHDDNPHLEDPFYFKYLTDPRALEIARSVLGPDLALLSSHIMSKTLRVEGEPWHFDSRRMEAYLNPVEVMGLLVAVEPFSARFGGLCVVPGTHKETVLIEQVGDEVPHAIPPERIDPRRVVPLELDVGHAVLLNPWVMHGSKKRDEAFIMRFMPTTVRCQGTWPQGMHPYLVSGVDRSGGHNVYSPLPSREPRV
jgi:Phytanoyl-CoA dioxygenase (PhyH)